MLNQKGFTPLYIILGILVIFIAIGAYVLGTKTKQPTPLTGTTSTKDNRESPQPSAPIKASVTGNSFQEILAKNCRKITSSQSGGVGTIDGSYFYGIKLEATPFKVDQTVINIKFRDQNTIACLFDDPSKKASFLDIQYGDNDSVFIYDKNSADAGHGGPSYIGPNGEKILQKGDITVSVFLGFGEGPSPINTIPLMARGIRELQLGGGTVFINVDREIMEGGESRLVNVLKKYSKPSENYPGEFEIAREGYEQEIVSTLFANPTKLGYPEDYNISQIEKILNAVSLK